MIFTAETQRRGEKLNLLWGNQKKESPNQNKFNRGAVRRNVFQWLVFLLAFSASLRLCGENAFAACPGDPGFDRQSILHYSGGVPPPGYNHLLSTAQIESMRHIRYRAGLQHNPGLTVAEHELKTDYQIAGLSHGRGKSVCVWVESLQIVFGYVKMEVYLSSQYAEGTCAYGVILAHENQHVAINSRVYAKYRTLMERVLRADKTIPTKANPMAVQSLPQGKAVIAARINRLINPIYERFKRESASENVKIDTAANYKRTQALCKEW